MTSELIRSTKICGGFWLTFWNEEKQLSSSYEISDEDASKMKVGEMFDINENTLPVTMTRTRKSRS